jgi:hypothetical protein
MSDNRSLVAVHGPIVGPESAALGEGGQARIPSVPNGTAVRFRLGRRALSMHSCYA